MKKRLVSAILLICVLFALSACGQTPQSAGTATPAPAAENAPTPLPAASAESAAPSEEPEPTPEPTPESPAFDEEKYNAALELIGEDVALLFEKIGEPFDSRYAPSCIGATGEDGELYYTGFYVATYRNGDKEIVWDVISDVG